MSANAQLAVPSNSTDWLTTEELEHALELSSRDPDAPHSPRTMGVLRRAAIAGATTGLAAGGPAGPSPWGAEPINYLELGSDTHDAFVH